MIIERQESIYDRKRIRDFILLYNKSLDSYKIEQFEEYKDRKNIAYLKNSLGDTKALDHFYQDRVYGRYKFYEGAEDKIRQYTNGSLLKIVKGE